MLAANNTFDFRTISDFRKDNLATLSGLFLQVLTLCQRAGRSVIAYCVCTLAFLWCGLKPIDFAS